MNYRIILAAGVVLVAAAAWFVWRHVSAPAVDTSEIVEAPGGRRETDRGMFVAAHDTAQTPGEAAE